MFTSWVSTNFFPYFSLGITVNVRLQSKLCMISESTAFVEVHESWAFFKLCLNLLQKLSANLGSSPSLAMHPFPLVSHLSSWIVTICSTEARQLFRFKDVASWWLKPYALRTSRLSIHFPSVQKTIHVKPWNFWENSVYNSEASCPWIKSVKACGNPAWLTVQHLVINSWILVKLLQISFPAKTKNALRYCAEPVHMMHLSVQNTSVRQ